MHHDHYDEAIKFPDDVDFFEIISENFLQTEGYPLYVVDRLAERYPLYMHGVSLSIASVDDLDFEYLGRLKKLARRIKAPFVSDHLCWTRVDGHNTHDLLPVPLTEEALAFVTGRVRAVQDFLELPLVIENASTYLQFATSTMPEWEFLSRLAEDADCGLLLDLNNMYVNGFNHKFDPLVFLAHVPVERIVYHHLAGHTHLRTYIKDTHSDHVIDAVWRLYEYCESRTGGRSTVIEWDVRTPSFDVMRAEMRKIREHAPQAMPAVGADKTSPAPRKARLTRALEEVQRSFHRFIVSADRPAGDFAWVLPTREMKPRERLDVYREQYDYSLKFALGNYYHACKKLIGDGAFDRVMTAYTQRYPSHSYNIFRLRDCFPQFVRTEADAPNVHARGFLYDLARLERAAAEAFDAPAEPRGDAPSLLAPSTRLLAFDYDVYPFWRDGQTLHETPRKNWVMVWRRGYTVMHLAIGHPMYRLLRLLQRGVPFERAEARVAAPAVAEQIRQAVRAAGILRAEPALSGSTASPQTDERQQSTVHSPR